MMLWTSAPESLGAEHIDTLRSRFNRVDMLQAAGRLDEASRAGAALLALDPDEQRLPYGRDVLRELLFAIDEQSLGFNAAVARLKLELRQHPPRYATAERTELALWLHESVRDRSGGAAAARIAADLLGPLGEELGAAHPALAARLAERIGG